MTAERRILNGELQRYLTGVLLFSLSILVLFYVLWAGCALLLGDSINPFAEPFATLEFNRHDWLEDAACSDSSNRRGHMARDIIDHHLHDGMTKTEIKNLLGEPGEKLNHSDILTFSADEAARHHSAPIPQADTAMIYYLGQDLGMMHGVGRAWLYLYFDAHNRYVGWTIWQP